MKWDSKETEHKVRQIRKRIQEIRAKSLKLNSKKSKRHRKIKTSCTDVGKIDQ